MKECKNINALYHYFDFEQYEEIETAEIKHNTLIIIFRDTISQFTGRYLCNVDDLSNRDDFNEIMSLFE